MANKTKNQQVGDFGENYAHEFLIKKRYTILFRNYRQKFDEIDIIARSFDRTLVFVEVKTLRKNDSSCLTPEDNLTKSKLKKISRACSLFVGLHEDFIDRNRGWRIDLVAVTIGDSDEEININHYENIPF